MANKKTMPVVILCGGEGIRLAQAKHPIFPKVWYVWVINRFFGM